VIRRFHADTGEDSKCSTTIIFQLIRRHVADYFLFLYTKDINVQQRPDGCQQKFLPQKCLSLSCLNTDIDIQGPFLKCYKYIVSFVHFAKQSDNYRTTIDHELLFLTVLHLQTGNVMTQNSATDTVLKYSNLVYPVTCVFYTFCAATVKLWSLSPRC
jgi:hypothetical protein